MFCPLYGTGKITGGSKGALGRSSPLSNFPRIVSLGPRAHLLLAFQFLVGLGLCPSSSRLRYQCSFLPLNFSLFLHLRGTTHSNLEVCRNFVNHKQSLAACEEIFSTKAMKKTHWEQFQLHFILRLWLLAYYNISLKKKKKKRYI